MNYVLSIDQSTQSTKAILFNQEGHIVKRVDKVHQQLVDEHGYVSHDPNEIYANTLQVVEEVVSLCHIKYQDIKAIGISNQRETTLIWDDTGKVFDNAVVWQCARASEIAKRYLPYQEEIFNITGLVLSPYFPACKMRWLLEYIKPDRPYYFGTMDTWLIYQLTNKTIFKTDASNASRTQLFDIHTGIWSKRLCELFEIDIHSLPEVCDSNACYGHTTFEGRSSVLIPIYAVMGDSHAALYGQMCHEEGNVKTTLGTGSSIMMNIGSRYKKSYNGLTTSLAWKIDGKMDYVFEGNINYAGAVISWLQYDLKFIESPDDTIEAVLHSNPEDETILIPAFTGLSAPYWKENACGMFYGMRRTTKRNELIKASLESIAYQVTDVLQAMSKDSELRISEVNVDGGPSKNTYLMQFLSDMAKSKVYISVQEELSAIGVAYLAGITAGIYQKEEVFAQRRYTNYAPSMDEDTWQVKMKRWMEAMDHLLGNRR